MTEKIRTLHPAGKKGVNIDKAKYDLIRAAILETLQAGQPMTFTEMTRQIETRLTGQFDGSIPWYVTCVKLDLEARGLIERVSKAKHQHLRLVEK